MNNEEIKSNIDDLLKKYKSNDFHLYPVLGTLYHIAYYLLPILVDSNPDPFNEPDLDELNIQINTIHHFLKLLYGKNFLNNLAMNNFDECNHYNKLSLLADFIVEKLQYSYDNINIVISNYSKSLNIDELTNKDHSNVPTESSTPDQLERLDEISSSGPSQNCASKALSKLPLSTDLNKDLPKDKDSPALSEFSPEPDPKEVTSLGEKTATEELVSNLPAPPKLSPKPGPDETSFSEEKAASETLVSDLPTSNEVSPKLGPDEATSSGEKAASEAQLVSDLPASNELSPEPGPDEAPSKAASEA
ncbi:MAG: hypothetical protein LBI10_11295, partial [Deltaproteobacteria bacterium]|nr:hypothetical protein [Deltaproteobacteria bacterium]